MPKTSPEVDIGKYLSTPELRSDPRNHSVPLFDVFDDPADPNSVILVIPLLRRLGDPLPESIGEVLDFIDQTLEVRNTIGFSRILNDTDGIPRVLHSFMNTRLPIGE